MRKGGCNEFKKWKTQGVCQNKITQPIPNSVKQKTSLHCVYYAPNFEVVEGAYWFLSVRLSVTLEPLEIGSCNLVCGMSMKLYFFLCPVELSLQSYSPFSMCVFFINFHSVSLWKVIEKQ